ncbi:putative ribosomal protein S23/S29 [Helianthus anomalus]
MNPKSIINIRFYSHNCTILRSSTASPAKSALITSTNSTSHHLLSSRAFATKKSKSSQSKGGNKAHPKSKSDAKSKSKSEDIVASSSVDDAIHDVISDERNRRRLLDKDDRNKALDAGPNGRPLFTNTGSLSEHNRKDACSYMKFSRKKLEEVLPERLPAGTVKEFEETMRDSLLVRHGFLDLQDNFRRIVDPPLEPYHWTGWR